MEPLTFVNIQWVKPLLQKLQNIRGERDKAVTALADVFGNPRVMLNYYIVPNCQHHNPADYHEDQQSRSYLKASLHESLQAFLGGETLVRGNGSNQMFILADAGMGKTTLLLMLKMWHLFSFWPKGYDCLLLKLGDDSLDQIKQHEGKANTVLLLDALDEDPLAHGRIDERLKELLEASRNYRQVLITCRTQFFPPTGVSPFRRSQAGSRWAAIAARCGFCLCLTISKSKNICASASPTLGIGSSAAALTRVGSKRKPS